MVKNKVVVVASLEVRFCRLRVNNKYPFSKTPYFDSVFKEDLFLLLRFLDRSRVDGRPYRETFAFK